jgi:hypothetical protein
MVQAEVLGHVQLPGEVIRTGWPIWYGFKKNSGAPNIAIGSMPSEVYVGEGKSQAEVALKSGSGGSGGCCGAQWW